MSLKEEVVQLKEVGLHMPSAVDNCTNTQKGAKRRKEG
jgi:hypothetical protein